MIQLSHWYHCRDGTTGQRQSVPSGVAGQSAHGQGRPCHVAGLAEEGNLKGIHVLGPPPPRAQSSTISGGHSFIRNSLP